MAVIQVESVAITKSRLAKGFNGDNLNLNGKVISSQEADAGFKAAGNVKPPYVAVIASGNQKGFAAGAAAAFNDYVKDVNINKHNAEAVINRFFDDMDAVVEKCSIDGARLSIGIVCAYDDCVVAAKTGNCHILRFSEGELFEIALSEDGERGFQFVDVIADGDVFALIGEESATDLDYDGIVNIFDQGNELKLAVRDVFKLLSVSARGKDCSVILMKLNCDAERTYAALPVADNSDAVFDSALSESPEDFAVPADYDSAENDEVADDAQAVKKSSKKKILGLIPVVILVILLAVAAALYFATRPEKTDEEGTSAPDIVVVMPEEDSTGDFNGSNGMQNVEDNGPGGEPGDDKPDETTTKEPETTTKRPSTTRPSTPSRPSTTQPSTSAPETTTAQSDETTTAQSDETTTAQSDETTTVQNNETTTQNTEVTTQNTEVTTQTPTTQAPVETPEEPGNETPAEPVNEEPVAVE